MAFQRSPDTDERAIERYRYMLETAPPDDIERAHEEAFARLTPEQRRQVLQELSRHVPESEIRGDDPASLARTATRAELREPGVLERTWSGPGLGGMFLSTLAGAFIGSAIAQQFFADDASAGEPGAGTESEAAGDTGDSGAGGGDLGGGDFGGDFGGGFGDLGF